MMEARLSVGRGFLVHMAALCVMIFVMAPLVVIVAISFSDAPFATFPPQSATLKWYFQVLQSGEFLKSIGLSVALAIASTLASLVLGIPAAFALERTSMLGKSFIQSLLLSPLVFPVLITGLALLQFYTAMGMGRAWFNLFLGYTLVTLPYVVRTVTASLKLVDISLEEAARTLGATRWQTFWRATFPQIAPGIAAGSIFAFMVALDNYPISMWLSDAQTTPVPVYLMNSIMRVFDPSIATMSTIMIVIGALAVIALEKIVGLRKAMAH